MPETREDAERLPELPPLGEGDETDSDGDFSDLLRSFEGDDGLDDSEAEELDAGVDLDDESTSLPEDSDSPLDIGEIVQASDDEDALVGDEVGPTGEAGNGLFDDIAGLELDADDAEGTVEPEDLIDEDLPVLMQEADEQEGALSDEADHLLGMDDEEPPRRAERSWLEVPVAPLSDCRVVRSAKGLVAAGGGSVAILGAEGEVNVRSDGFGAPVTTLLLDDAGTVLFATDRGKVFRLLGGTAAAEELVGFRDALPLDPEKPVSLSLGGPTPSTRPAALLRVSAGGGVLLESTDRGTTWRRVDLGGSVLAVSAGVPPMCIVEGSRGAHLFRSEASGAFRRLDEELAASDRTELASDHDVVVLLDPGSGVRVSADGGVGFRTVAGCSHATAVTAGRLGGRPSAFAALFDAASGHASLVWVDAASGDAYVVSELSPDPDLDNDLDEWTKVVSLAWDAAEETLWAAGAFGVRRWRRPPSA
ncbi:MAG TPA: hypothetical protein VHC69_11520 [Polyangiaceae bacterium]|nr:hypothetical protein [Polyangiaceae bacterium]